MLFKNIFYSTVFQIYINGGNKEALNETRVVN